MSAAVVQPVDLSADESFRDGFPHDYFTWLRDHQPVHWHEPTPRIEPPPG